MSADRSPRSTFYEFFAGGGMVRAGLGDGWDCLFANDFDAKKGISYAANWGADRLRIEDVAILTTADLPGRADLAWASFPCQDLSLAGGYAGLKGARSGTFWPFWRLMQTLVDEGRAPALIALENVCGALTSHDGKDFAAIGAALAGSGYRFGALVMDAVHFLPQSRPRLFIIGVHAGRGAQDRLTTMQPDPLWHSASLVSACERLSPKSKAAWLWWKIPPPARRTSVFADFIEGEPEGVAWHTPEETLRLVSLMSPLNLRKVEQAKRMGRLMVGGIYKRTRADENGNRVQRVPPHARGPRPITTAQGGHNVVIESRVWR